MNTSNCVFLLLWFCKTIAIVVVVVVIVLCYEKMLMKLVLFYFWGRENKGFFSYININKFK